MWPFRRHKRAGRGGRDDATCDIVSWAQRTLNDPVFGMPPVPDLLDPRTDVSDTAAESGDWRSSVQDQWKDGWAPTYTEVAKESEDDGAQVETSTEVAKESYGGHAWADPGTTMVVVTTQSPAASEGEAHIFGDAQEAKHFVERLIDDGFDRECIKTIRGDQTHFNLSFRSVVDFD